MDVIIIGAVYLFFVVISWLMMADWWRNDLDLDGGTAVAMLICCMIPIIGWVVAFLLFTMGFFEKKSPIFWGKKK